MSVLPFIILGLSAFIFPLLFFVTAPYGRHQRQGWGPSVDAKWSWVVMEAVSFFSFAAVFIWKGEFAVTQVLLAAMYLGHYFQRSFIFPLLMRGTGKKQPLLTAALAVVFNVMNGSGNAFALQAQELSVRLVLGIVVFAAGMALNLWADAKLRGLRKGDDGGYSVPRGGAYELVSSPNYLGELIEWTGFALAANTLAAWAFVAFTFANLAPRAWSHHKWYRATFADYPTRRRALVPLLW